MKDRDPFSNLSEAERAALLDGRHGLDLEAGLKAIAARFAQLLAEAKDAASARWSRLQARLEDSQARKVEADERKAHFYIETHGREPRIITPVVMITAALVVICTEAVFLRPLLDGLAITSALGQWLAALGIVLSWTVITDTALFLISGGALAKRIIGVALLVAAGAGLVAFGLWRREILAAAVHNSELRRLYELNPTVTSTAMLALAVVFPFGAAFVIWLYLPELEHALRGRRINRAPSFWYGRICWLDAEQRAVGASLKMRIEWLQAREREERERRCPERR